MMMKILAAISFGFFLLAVMPTFSQTGNTGVASANDRQQQTKPQQVKSNVASNSQPRDGQQVFNQNCSRCHNAPQGFSPRISGTVVRHMRVRAGLSKEDEQALLRFFNP
jgi:mono/diheme cytochrome c family protein